jgi:hypothetical protein
LTNNAIIALGVLDETRILGRVKETLAVALLGRVLQLAGQQLFAL